MIRTISISLCTLLLFSCGKKKDAQPEPKPEMVTASIQGRVLDESGRLVDNITVKTLDASTITNKEGEFRFDKVNLDKTNAFVYAEVTGYFKTGKTFTPQTGNTGFTEIQLIRKNKITAVPSASPGLVTFETRNTIQLPDNGMINKTQKTPYQGEISIFASYIDPATLKNTSKRPGGNYGYDRSGKKKALRPYGMLAIELEGTGGEKLQLANGKTAVIKIAIPASMAPTAPASIPLWYFDEEKGIWKEEGTATKQGDVYTGTVSHFSFWSADMPEEMINLSMQFKNTEDKPFSFHRMRISETGNDSSYIYLYTDSSGRINTAVPRNKELRVRLYSTCMNELKNFTVPPMAEDKDLNLLTVDALTTRYAIIRGKVTTCDGTPLRKGYALIQQKNGHSRMPLDEQGQYMARILICQGTEATIAVIGVDTLNKQESTTPYYQKIAPGGEYNIPTVQACGFTGETYFDVVIDGKTFSFTPPEYGSFGTRNLYASGQDTGTHVYTMKQDGSFFQNVSITYWGPSRAGYGHQLKEVKVYTGPDTDLKGILTGGNWYIAEYGVAGQYIAGNFTINMENRAQQNKIVPVTIRFRVRRLM
ncbi:carboxypeptidase-like regulatory domain-containing protein [Chitinophaga niabensis]|uniref:carboxypeptidase-like regulatory domain-containing protein n=1 Tax=Chitinophaga niabensis TaxID=536979 RepID=UPI0031BA3404